MSCVRMCLSSCSPQVSERTDCHFENLQIGLSLWDKLLLLAMEVESWSNDKLRALAQSHPFQTEQEVLVMQVSFADTSDEQLQCIHYISRVRKFNRFKD